MAIVEDGTGVEGADSYIDTDYADAYHAARGHTAWAAAVAADKETAIVRATDMIDSRFGARFKGYKRYQGQSLEWPRSQVYDRDSYLLPPMPDQLKRACAEYALRALLYGVLVPDPPPPGPRQTMQDGETVIDETAGAGRIQSTKSTVGPLSESVTYQHGTSNAWPRHPIAEMHLRPLLVSWRNQRIVRG